jgi:hypothetical protein
LEGSRQLQIGALFCGLGQGVVFFLIFVGVFISESSDIWGQASIVALNAEKGETMDPVQVRLTTGALGLMAFVLQPLHLFYGYMAVEGVVRAFAASALGHVLPTFPLGLLSAVHSGLDARIHGRKLAVLFRDAIEPARDDTYDLHILSYRRKREWSPHIGIRFQGELYLLDGEQDEAGPRPFGYRLRKNPEGNLVVVVCNYDPVAEKSGIDRR